MSEEILINVTPQETRAAVLEHGVLQEVLIERSNHRGIVGNIYMGRVARVMPGMDAAFVDIGLERSAFIHASDVDKPSTNEIDEGVAPKQIPVAELLKENQTLLVQVVKDPLGTKGARLTTQITIPSRFLVFLPNEVDLIGISSKIDDEDERERLKAMTLQVQQDYVKGGFIVRTVAEGTTEAALQRDARYLQKVWASIQSRQANASAGTLIHEDLPLASRLLRDMVNDEVSRVLVDSEYRHERLLSFAGNYTPGIVDKIEYYQAERPIFDLHGVEDEIQKALHRKVFLKSGGYLIIDQTEAMTTVDVNTGGYVGHRTLEETIYKTNLEAAQSIARQLRLRNLGGIIIIDFIDMQEEEHKRQVLRALEKYLERDHTRTQVTAVSELGLVEMTRKRTRESLEHILCETCPTCGGRGSIKTAETVCYEIFREIIQVSRQYSAKKLVILACQPVIDLLGDDQSSSLAELEADLEIPIQLQLESLYTQEQYDVVIM